MTVSSLEVITLYNKQLSANRQSGSYLLQYILKTLRDQEQLSVASQTKLVPS